jgi:epoxyqueuosine reductase
MPISISETLAPAPARDLRRELAREAHALGFDAVGFASAEPDAHTEAALERFIQRRLYGDMTWMAETAPRRASPRALWPEARSVIMLGLNYSPVRDPLFALAERSRGAISVYARGRDYHDIIKRKLKRLAARLQSLTGEEVKIFVDTAPVMEKPLAVKAGIGWQGKHTNLVSRDFGSWLFLGSIFTTAFIPPDEAEADHCGACTRCLDVCPTEAFLAPYQLDARRCISYLTIEHKGHIAQEFREAIGNRIFGCDDCLAVCPWNKFAQLARDTQLEAAAHAGPDALYELLDLDDAAFRARFAGTSIKRTGRDRFLRNVLIAAGNSADPDLIPKVEAHLADNSPLVRAMAVWALSQLSPERVAVLRESRLNAETDPAVAGEWRRAT